MNVRTALGLLLAFGLGYGVGAWRYAGLPLTAAPSPPAPNTVSMPAPQSAAGNSATSGAADGPRAPGPPPVAGAAITAREPAAASPAVSPPLSGTSRNLWGLATDDGKSLDTSRLFMVLQDNHYARLLAELTQETDYAVQVKVQDGMTAAARDSSVSARVEELACSARMCLGKIVVSSTVDARAWIRALAKQPALETVIGGISMNMNEGSNGFGRVMFVIDPAIESTFTTLPSGLRVGFTPRLTPEQQETLRKMFAPQLPPDARAPP